MPDLDELETDLESLSEQWTQLTSIPESPRSTMQIIEYKLGERRRAEEYVNRLLRYFLHPDRPHGMDDEFLRTFLEAVPNSFEFDPATYDLSTVEVHQQVPITSRTTIDGTEERSNRGRLDLLIEKPNEWSLLVELKFNAPDTQTEFYCDASHINDVAKTEYESGHHYLFLKPADRPDAAGACFENWDWTDLREDVIVPLSLDRSPRFPTRTANQLRELIDDIKHVTNMDEQADHQQRKEELYLEHYEAIAEVTDAFEDRWEQFSQNWPRRLAESLADRDDVTAYTEELPAEILRSIAEDDAPLYAAIELDRSSDASELWTFRGTHHDWSHLFMEGWWRLGDDLEESVHDRIRGNDIRIGFHHRLERNLELALRDNTLVLYFRNMGANPSDFSDAFVEAMDQRRHDIQEVLPDQTEWTGNKGDRLRAEYAFNLDAHGSIFEAYTDALHRAYVDHVIDNDELVDLLDQSYYEAVERVYGTDVR